MSDQNTVGSAPAVGRTGVTVPQIGGFLVLLGSIISGTYNFGQTQQQALDGQKQMQQKIVELETSVQSVKDDIKSIKEEVKNARSLTRSKPVDRAE